MNSTVRTDDGLKHIVHSEADRGFNGWHYYFVCGDDAGYMSRAERTDEAPTCLQCIDKHVP